MSYSLQALRWLRILIFLGMVPFAMGCAEQRLTQFHNFAQAGTAYVAASQSVLGEAGTAAIDADSLIVQRGRDGLKTPAERRQYIIGNDDELRRRLFLLQQIGRHGKLLQSYFQALANLSDPKAPSTIGTAAQEVFDSISKLSPSIKSASILGVKVEDQIPAVTNFVVQSFKVKALEAELKARSKHIEREIALQEAAFKLIGQTLETDLTAQLQLQELNDVIDPFATAPQLPANWAQRRQLILQARVASQSAQSAADAAAKLRESFVALVENQQSEPSIAQLISAVNSMLDLTAKIQQASPSK